MSADFDDKGAARALRSGFQAHLSKPVEPDALIKAINGLAGTAAPTEP